MHCGIALNLLLLATPILADEPIHVSVYSEVDQFAGWPANSGLWSWESGNEALVGFTTGKYQLRNGHNLTTPYTNRLARTTDGGQTWKVVNAKGYYQTGDRFEKQIPAIDFSHPDLAMRFLSTGYHGGTEQQTGLIYSIDRGQSWRGPFELPTIIPEADTKVRPQVNLRTDYLIREKECYFFGSARDPKVPGSDRCFAAKLSDGGRTLAFLGWIDPPERTIRTLMPATISLGNHRFLSLVRARQLPAAECWIEGFITEDAREWKSLGKIAETGTGNGNPAAVIQFRDQRIACVYGNRSQGTIELKWSATEGKQWSEAIVLRSDYDTKSDREIDLGYPRLFQRKDGAIVAVYYWRSASMPNEQIAATILKLPARDQSK